MNVQEYIESGSIESCVMQLASEREQRELDRLCREYPEIRAARLAFEEGLEKAAMEGAVQPAPFIRDIVLSLAAGQQKVVVEKITPPRKFAWPKMAFAASLLLLAGSTALNIYLYKNYTATKDYNATLLTRQQELANTNKNIQARLSLAEKDMAMLKDPNMVMVKMEPMNNSNSMGTVYWDARSKDVYLLLNQMAQPQDGYQYQLWAMVDGIPVDAGMIDFDQEKHLHRMKNIPRAEAFAITLEKTGGSPTPTMSNLLVMGKV